LTVGASAGLALAVGLGERHVAGHAVMAGLLGAVLGSIAFDMIGAAAFTNARTFQPISDTWPTRLLARLLVTIGTDAAVAVSLPGPRATVTHRETNTA
jgi:hypothetical protein